MFAFAKRSRSCSFYLAIIVDNYNNDNDQVSRRVRSPQAADQNLFVAKDPLWAAVSKGMMSCRMHLIYVGERSLVVDSLFQIYSRLLAQVGDFLFFPSHIENLGERILLFAFSP